MVYTLQINADHGRDFHPPVDYMTKLRNFTKGIIREFSAFIFSLQLMFHQIVSNGIVRLMILHKNIKKIAQTSSNVAVDTNKI